jgi:phage minor structural protein
MQSQFPAESDRVPVTACPYLDAVHTEKLTGENTFSFSVPADHADAQYVTERNLVAFKDLDAVWQLFEIKRLVDLHGDGLTRTAYCEHAFYELIDDFIEDVRPTDCSATFALTQALSGTRWSVGTVADLGTNNTNYYYESILAAVQKVASVWGGELQFRIVVTGGVISNRYVDLLTRRGSDTGKQFAYGRHLQEMQREVDLTTVITAAYGRGKGVETDSGGFGRRLDFSDIVWTTPGNPANKPAGQEWVGDLDALAVWGRAGGTRHRYGVFEDSEEIDAATLLQNTWNYLQEHNTPRITYSMTVIDLERLTGYSHEAVRLGDTTRCIDRVFSPELLISARVIEIARDLVRPENTKITLGNFAPTLADDALTQRQINKSVSAAFNPTKGTLATAWLDGIINVLQNEIQNTAAYVFQTETDGILIINAATFETATKAMKLGGGTFALANSKSGNSWVWRAFGTGDGFTADELNAGIVNTSLVKIQGNTYFYWDGDYLYIVDPTDTNKQIRLSKEGIRFTADGGTNWTVAIDVGGINAPAITTGILDAARVQVGAATTYEEGYNPNIAISQMSNPYFEKSKALWSSEHEGETVPETTVGTIVPGVGQNGGKVMQIVGDVYTIVNWSTAIPISDERIYKLRYSLRQITEGIADISYYGIYCLDSNYELISTPSFPLIIAYEDGWKTVEEIIEGSTFPVGTAYIRPMFLVNLSGGHPDGYTQIDMLEFTDITEAYDAQQTAGQAITAAATAQATADGKVTTFFQDNPPTAEGIGDLWIDTNDGNKLYRWSGSAWTAVQDAGIGQAITDAATAQATADGKVVTFYQTITPTADGAGDLWYKTDTKVWYRWSGSAWALSDGAQDKVDTHNDLDSPHNLPSYVTTTPDGVKVFDNLAALRCWLGQYALGKYGLLVINGEIYSSLIRSTSQDGSTTYIELAADGNLNAVGPSGYRVLNISAGANQGKVILYDSGVEHASIFINSVTTKDLLIWTKENNGIKLLADTGEYITLGSTDGVTRQGIRVSGLCGDIVPHSDSSVNCGTSLKRWLLVRGVTITSGDLAFEESECAICKGKFEDGDILCLLVKTIHEEMGTLTIPVHERCKDKSATFDVQITETESKFELDDSGELKEYKVTKLEETEETVAKINKGYELNERAGSFKKKAIVQKIAKEGYYAKETKHGIKFFDELNNQEVNLDSILEDVEIIPERKATREESILYVKEKRRKPVWKTLTVELNKA